MINILHNVRHLFALAVVVAVALLLSAGISRADDVVLDDQIVLGNECVGVDCSEGEVFGLTTLRLKENNLRIFFHDTSTSAQFPRNDWEILVNDSANGGKNFLGFADRGEDVATASGAGLCEGSADDGLMCGLPGQANCLGACNGGFYPGVACDLNSGCPTGVCAGGTVPGSSCTDSSSCGGGTCEIGTCENAGACVPFGGVIFSIEAGAPENSLVIDQSGRLGVGTGAPGQKLHVRGSAQIDGTLYTNRLELTSSKTYKRDIQDLGQGAALDVLKDLRPVTYRLNAQPDEPTLGFIAEDVPELVASGGRATVNPVRIIAVLTRALQAQQQLIENQEQEANQLEGRIFDLEQALLTEEGGSK